MTIPAVTGKVVEPVVIGGSIRLHHKVISGPTSYTTGGDEIDVRDLGDTWLLHAMAAMSTDGSRIAHFFPSPNADAAMTKKMKMFIVTAATGVEVANGSNQSSKEFVVPVLTVG